ncbi:MAG: YbaN family protein [Hyphomonas sp.]|nr:YbaN family protein [Hyphomonas sp.]
MWIWRAVGIVAFALGAIGLAVPVWPTTVFWIVAAIAFARSNPDWADWIFRQPGIGPPIRTFLETGAMARPAKVAALSGMALAAAIVVATGYQKPWVLGIGLGLIAIGALYVMTRKAA